MLAYLNHLIPVGYLVALIIFTATYALFSLGLNLQWGFTGLINFGHVAFLTVGAYTTVLLSLQGVPLLLAVLSGAAVSAILGLVIGISTLRLREDYLAIVTIGVSEVVRLVALNEEWLTRGAFGVYGYALPMETLTRPTLFSRIGMIGLWTGIFGLAGWFLWRWLRRRTGDRPNTDTTTPPRRLRISQISWLAIAIALGITIYLCGTTALFYYTDYPKAGLMLLLVTVLALVYWRLEVLVKSPWGRVLKAIREDEEVAKALGKNVFWYKMQALMLGGAIAGLAGAFYAWNLTFINPDGFIPLITFQAWTIVVLGGAGSNAGTLLGAVIYQAYYSLTRFLPNGLEQLHGLIPVIPPSLDAGRLDAFRLMLIGFLLIILMMVRPQGILGKKEELTLGR